MMTKNQQIGALVAVWVVAVSLVAFLAWRDYAQRPAYVVPDYGTKPPAGAATDTPPVFDDGGSAAAHSDLIRVDTPKNGDIVKSPLTITGEARGNWYFEASFPVRLEDGNGKVLAQHYAQAEGEWMTTEFVPFTSTFPFDPPTTPTGTLILMKDNPSGLPEHDDEIRILVRFDEKGQVTATGGCRPTGCSGQVCAAEDMVTTCEFRPEYECYKDAGVRCERQSNGDCGWTQTVDLIACLNDNAEVR
jgi:hypothetical protein